MKPLPILTALWAIIVAIFMGSMWSQGYESFCVGILSFCILLITCLLAKQVKQR